MYQNQHGRFTAIDPLLASGKSANPQTFNRYAYGLNRPLALNDPTGLQAGKWYEPVDENGKPRAGEFLYHYSENPLPNGYQLMARTNKAGELISSPEGHNHVFRFNPNGPYEPMSGLDMAFLILSDYAYNGYDVIASDTYEGSSIEHPVDGYSRGSEFVTSPYEIAAAASPFRSAFFGRVGARAATTETITVGRWMGQGEFSAMSETGMVQESTSTATHVAFPANPNTFMGPAKAGSVYVEFGVPRAAVVESGTGIGRIAGPSSIDGRFALKMGRSLPQMPQASNITCIICRTDIP